ncbi:zinc-ribbon domain-containing protein [Pseudonocardia eucalypti]|uniref:Zinc-ribbon domain-containing protein n=1 Tax=Pseudonocardia eucalypti TaxID=648755 RepID=A0ABP9PXY3_9PSEU|nr:endogenous inhibitor of DNA gyrase (YacG/DUF329 family) [Pseudonocardia eucalypti]
MLVIFGVKRYLEQLAMLSLGCPNCGTTSAHPLRRAYSKFTLFFIPLFVVSSRYQVQCTYCGLVSGVSKQRALELRGASVR